MRNGGRRTWFVVLRPGLPTTIFTFYESVLRFTFADNARSTTFTWNRLRPGCLPRILVTIPDTWGAAKLLPVAVIHCPCSQGTLTSMPGAPNSTGGWGL